jgi:hypothetical protein
MDGAMLQGVLIDQAIEVLFQLARDFRRATGARAIDSTLRTLAGKAIDPLAQGGIRKLERVRDGLQTLPFHDIAHGLGTAEDAGFFGLL